MLCFELSTYGYSLPPDITGKKLRDGCHLVLQLLYTYIKMESLSISWKVTTVIDV